MIRSTKSEVCMEFAILKSNAPQHTALKTNSGKTKLSMAPWHDGFKTYLQSEITLLILVGENEQENANLHKSSCYWVQNLYCHMLFNKLNGAFI